MGILASLLIGAFIGWGASTVMGTGDRQGLLITISIGMSGAALGFWLFSSFADVAMTRATFVLLGSLLPFSGAVVLLVAAKLARLA